MTMAPTIFLGHGAVRDAVQDNWQTAAWRDVAKRFLRPRAILCISAHWQTDGTRILGDAAPVTIHDFGGYPPEFYEIRYPAPGDPVLAARIAALLAPIPAHVVVREWGYDHGTWSALRWMYPDADMPVVVLGMDRRLDPAGHLAIGRALSVLREEGVLIIGSGNIAHNLPLGRPYTDIPAPWCQAFDDAVIEALIADREAMLIEYPTLPGADRAAASDEHYLPLLYVAGARQPGERPFIFNRRVMSAISTTCVAYGLPDG